MPATTRPDSSSETDDPNPIAEALAPPIETSPTEADRVNLARQRLEKLAREQLRDVHLVVVSNREPYLHSDATNSSKWYTPASGLTTALDPVMRICRGTWVAHGSGAGDRLAADEDGRVQVPPDEPLYTLRRVWLTNEEIAGYYNGFANQTLWPLCHHVHVKPRFDSDEWLRYRTVNQHFANAVLAQIENKRAIVLVQDYHLALVAGMIKAQRPDVVVSQFWHIPWPSAETMRLCPWHGDILRGLLGNDVLGFHVPHYCNNFLTSVASAIEARIDHDESAVIREGHRTLVRPYPISIDPATMQPDDYAQIPEVDELIRNNTAIVLGIDRMDYIKGIPEKIAAFAKLLEDHPEHHGGVSLVQAATPTRSDVPAYAQLADEIESLSRQVNDRFGKPGWQPVVLLRRLLDAHEIATLYRSCTVCVVGSLHDGMNLVAKEFVAARTDLRGVLVLSRFAGATADMRTALHVHPYDRDAYAATLGQALRLPPHEQEKRMRYLRELLADNSIYTWAENLLQDAITIERLLA